QVATVDWYSRNRQYIVQRLIGVATAAPNRLYVVVDLSESLKDDYLQIREAISSIPSRFQPLVYSVCEPIAADEKQNYDTETQVSDSDARQSEIAGLCVKEALDAIKRELFVGGKDNQPVLREALETAAEQPGNAVLWIHGPQPLAQNATGSIPLDLVRSVRLYDLQIGPGPNSISPAVQKDDLSKRLFYRSIQHQESISQDLHRLMSEWQTGTNNSKQLIVQRRKATLVSPLAPVTDRTVSAQTTCLWANEEVTRLIAAGQEQEAEKLALQYRIVTPITGAVVLDNLKDYKANKLDGSAFVAGQERRYSRGLIGATDNSRYGQWNQVGSLADFGYDTARDISRVLTGSSFLIALVVGTFFLRAGDALTGSRMIKTIVLVLSVPTIVHLCGTFAINNYGGLGGGL
ncbi:MAG: hypothetical protein K2Z81_05600, partial [Cyanobacteria bacterium]|nr:hypothetical protein [Cyanobacteriota bacterium]